MDRDTAVYVPYANELSEPEVLKTVELNLQVLGFVPQLVKMEHAYSYGEFINELWVKHSGNPFILVEHDVFPYPVAIRDLLQCPEPFCTYGGTMQCCKLTPTGKPPLPEKTDWMHVDAVLWQKIKPHVHFPEVANVNRANIPK